MAPASLASLADLTEPARVKRILQRVAARTGRMKGGHVSQLATVLLLAARDHAGRPAADIKRLEYLQRATLPARSMGDRTLQRLQPFDDPAKLAALLALPDRLIALAKRHGDVDIQSARLVRCAVFLALLIDTVARQGNIVSLDLDSHLQLGPNDQAAVHIPGELVKNGEEIRSPLRPATVRKLRSYLSTYRQVHAGTSTSSWLFPTERDTHWSTTAAGQTLKELTARYVGADVNPHLIRALVGEMILQEQPGGLNLVKDVLGHRTVSTSTAFYLRQDRARARKTHQALLDRRSGSGR